MKNSYITVTDQFCGAGGSSIGATIAGAEVRLAMNHWKLAIDTHNTNFPNVDHDCADMSAVDPRRYPSTDILITSPSCTNHSLAKGKPRRYYERDLFGNVLIDPADERSRATMWDVPRFAEYHEYRLIIVENVVDAGKWRLFDAWLNTMNALDYQHEVVYFNSMFAPPTPQSRDRMYIVFWKKGNRKPDLEFHPAAPCQRCNRTVEAIQTWKKRSRWGRYKKQYIYRCPHCHQEVMPFYYAAINAVDPTIQAERIGDREKPLRPKTLERIKYGLETYGRKPLIITTRYTSGVECRARDAGMEPLPTQPGDSSHALVLPWMVETGYTQSPDNRAKGSLEPGQTQTARQSIGVVSAPMPYFVKTIRTDEDLARGASSAMWTQTTCQDVALVAPSFIAEMHGTSKASGVDDPLMCVTADGNHHALISANSFLAYYYGGHQQVSDMADPIYTVTATDRAGLVGALDSMTVNDLTFRMLQAHEIGKAMAFPNTYVVLGTQREKVKQYGNAVTPPVMEMIIRRCMDTFQ